jgi:hypothetical protein
MVDLYHVLFLPFLVGALSAVGFCGVSKFRKRRPSFWVALCIALVIGLCALFFLWRDSSGNMPFAMLLLFGFGLFFLTSFISAAVVISLYRFQMHK